MLTVPDISVSLFSLIKSNQLRKEATQLGWDINKLTPLDFREYAAGIYSVKDRNHDRDHREMYGITQQVLNMADVVLKDGNEAEAVAIQQELSHVLINS